jgi:alginate O-acetyltransferase complex protein AlgJ
VVELFILPLDFGTFRCWEALSVNKYPEYFYGSLYPNSTLLKTEVGDLAHHTQFAKEKLVFFQTDKYGFRNTDFIKNPKILIIGDSFTWGGGLNQDEIVSSVLNRDYPDVTSYNIAPANFNTFIQLLSKNIINKPEMIVLSCIERNILEDYYVPNIGLYDKKVKSLGSKGQYLYMVADRISKKIMWNYFSARIKKSTGSGIQSSVNKNLFFFQGEKVALSANEETISKFTERIVTYKKYCDSLGIKFVFLPIPNKETILYKLVPLQSQPDILIKLHQELLQRNIATINTLDLFNYNNEKGIMLYQADDTHWNKTGVKLAAKEIMNEYKKERRSSEN